MDLISSKAAPRAGKLLSRVADPHSGQHRELTLVQIWETLSTAAKAVFFFAVTPVLLRKLGAEGYGLLAMAFSTISLVVGLDLDFERTSEYR